MTYTSRATFLLFILLVSCKPESSTENVEVEKTSNSPAPAAENRYHFSQPVMGTTFQITCYSENESKARTAAFEAFQLAKEIELVCSDYTSKSEINRVLNTPRSLTVSDTLAEVLGFALIMAKETEGAFDPTIGHHTYNWRRAKAKQKLPDQETTDKAKSLTGWQKIWLSGDNVLHRSSDNLRVDLGGIAKGYAADKMLALIKNHGIPSAMIAAGGDVRLGDAPPESDGWKVGIKNLTTSTAPANKLPYVILKNCAISTSGDLHQYIEIDGTRYSHIVNPTTGLGLTRRVSATVIAPTAIQSDTLATASCVSQEYANKLLSKKTKIKLLLAEKNSQTNSTNFPTIHQQP